MQQFIYDKESNDLEYEKSKIDMHRKKYFFYKPILLDINKLISKSCI